MPLYNLLLLYKCIIYCSLCLYILRFSITRNCYLYVSFLRNFRDKLELSAVKNAANIYDNYTDILEYKSLCYSFSDCESREKFEALRRLCN